MISGKHAELRLFGSNGWNAACLIKLNKKHADGQNGPLPGATPVLSGAVPSEQG